MLLNSVDPPLTLRFLAFITAMFVAEMSFFATCIATSFNLSKGHWHVRFFVFIVGIVSLFVSLFSLLLKIGLIKSMATEYTRGLTHCLRILIILKRVLRTQTSTQ